MGLKFSAQKGLNSGDALM